VEEDVYLMISVSEGNLKESSIAAEDELKIIIIRLIKDDI